MGIQDVLAYMGWVDAGGGQRGPGAGKERPVGVREGEIRQLFVSCQARTMYEAEQTRKFDVVRERVRLGYYLRKDVQDTVVDALAKEVTAENAA